MSIPSWAHVGAKVVCVDASAPAGCSWVEDDSPVVGQQYTIVRAFIGALGNPSVHLMEIERGPRARRLFGDNIGYGLFRFRPLVSIEGDLAAHFHKLLDVPAGHELEGV